MRRTAVAAAVVVLAVAGCSSSKSKTEGAAAPPARGVNASAAATSSSGGIPVGPGPQNPYKVQPQPPAGSCHYGSTAGKEPMPDVHCTPGATNPDVTQATIGKTICVKGYTATIRPPASITGAEKTANAKSYGYTGSMRDAEYDHLISLELGGDPNDPRNLWVEAPDPGHATGAGPNNAKDGVETKLKTAICGGRVKLAAAQQAIATDWTTALAKLGIS